VFEFLPNQKLWALAVGIFLNQYDSRTVEYMNLASYFFTNCSRYFLKDLVLLQIMYFLKIREICARCTNNFH